MTVNIGRDTFKWQGFHYYAEMHTMTKKKILNVALESYVPSHIKSDQTNIFVTHRESNDFWRTEKFKQP